MSDYRQRSSDDAAEEAMRRIWGDAITHDDGGGSDPGDDGGSDEPERPPADDDDGGGGEKKKRKRADPLDVFNEDGSLNADNLDALFTSGDMLNTEALKNIYGAIGGQSMRDRMGLYGERVQRERELAAGSPAALMQKFGANLQKMQAQLGNAMEAVSRRLGPQGGGQLKQANAAALSQAAMGLQGQMAMGQQQGIAGLHAALGLQPVQGANIPTKFTETRPFDPSQLGEALAGAVGTVYDAYGGRSGGAGAGASFDTGPAMYHQNYLNNPSGRNAYTGQSIYSMDGKLGGGV